MLVHYNEFAAKLKKNPQKLGVKTLCKNEPHVHATYKKYRKKAGMKAQEDYPTMKNGGKKDLKTTLHLLHITVSCNRRRVAFLSLSSTIFHSRVAFLCFHPCLVSLCFTGPPLLVVNSYRKF